MSIFIWKETSNAQRPTSNVETVAEVYDRRKQVGAPGAPRQIAKLLDDLEDRPLAMARSRTGEQRANSLNGLAAAANNAADVSSSKLQLKNRGSAAWNFRQNHVVRKFYQLANDKLEELSHALEE